MIVLPLVQKLHHGGVKNRLIEDIPYNPVIDAVGGAEDFS